MQQLSIGGRFEIGPTITRLASMVMKELKGAECEVLSEKVNWVEFKGYRTLLKNDKEELFNQLKVMIAAEKRGKEEAI